MSSLDTRLKKLEQAGSGGGGEFVILLGGIDDLPDEPRILDIAPPEATGDTYNEEHRTSPNSI